MSHLRKYWKRYLLAAVAAYAIYYGLDPQAAQDAVMRALEALTPK